MSDFFSDLKVSGYPYSDLVWGVVPPVHQPPGPLGHNMRDHLFNGGECQTEFKGETAKVHPSVSYAAKLDQTPSAIAASQAHYDQDQPADLEDRTEGIGMARLARIESGVVMAERCVPLDELDEAHVLDKLSGAALAWHAEVFGPPQPEVAVTPRRSSRP